MSNQHKTLYLVRHAKSSWKDPTLSDRDRPLNKRGRRTAPDMGRRMSEQGHRPDLIISSPANRALSTARIIADAVNYSDADICINEGLYFSGQRQMVNVVAGLDERHQSAMLVGHNPAMTWFMNYLTGSSVYNMPTCAIAVIGFDIDHWADLPSAKGELLGYDFPKGAGSFTGNLPV